jgi:hypothetical protein
MKQLWLTVPLLALGWTLLGRSPVAAAPPSAIHFDLVPNPQFVPCLAQFPGDARHPPTAHVAVVRGSRTDVLFVKLTNLKPGLALALFSVQHSPLRASGQPDPAFQTFGLAWYQADLEVNAKGLAAVTLETMLLDQSFGVDPAVELAPTHTFHVGLWFHDPHAAAACGFDPSQPTPFNGAHQAGPNALISLPDPQTELGPLCTDPDPSTTPPSCHR